jgi:uncharacterized protein YdcH (DUF465 family)
MLTREKLEHHINHLQEMHDRLDKEITEKQSHHDNEFEIEKLKKQKLNLKDDIERIRRQINGM